MSTFSCSSTPLRGVEGVEVRVVPQGHGARLHHEVVDGELEALLFELLVELLAQRHRGVHLDLDGGVEVRDVLLGLGHPLADDLHHPRRLDELRPGRLGRLGEPRGLEALHLGLLGLRRPPAPRPSACPSAFWRRRRSPSRPARRARRCGRPDRSLRPWRGRGRSPRARRRTIGEARNWPSARPSAWPVGLPRSSSSSGASSSVSVAVWAWASPPSPPSSASCLGLFGAAAVTLGHLLALARDKGYSLADGDVLALVGYELGEGAGVLGFELERDLVGLDLGYRVALGDLVALALEPLDEGALLHRVAHLGHDHFRHLTSPLCRAPGGPRSLPASRSGRPRAPGSARKAPGPRPRSPAPPARPGSRRPAPG